MSARQSNKTIISSLVLVIILWGANNTGTKYLVASWPPIWVGCSRFFAAGVLLSMVLRGAPWLGGTHALSASIRRRLWWHSGLSLAVYIVVFNWAVRFIPASHVALYIGASPVWTLLAEERPDKSWRSLQRYGSALLALGGVVVLLWPALKLSATDWLGELLGLAASMLWACHGRQCRSLGATLSGVEVTACTMWRAAIWMLPLAGLECAMHPPAWRMDLVWVQVYCVLGGGVAAFGLWNNALRHWPTSQVFLFINLIPLSTMIWAHFCLGESVSRTFWLAMALIVSAVVLAQTRWHENPYPPE